MQLFEITWIAALKNYLLKKMKLNNKFEEN